VGEAHVVALRFGAPGLAAVALLVLVGGARGLGSLLLLAAIVAAAVRLVETVGLAAEGRGDRFTVATSGAGLVFLVAAGAAHVPLLAVGLLACSAVELLGAVAPTEVVSEPVELLEAPVSRAA